MLLHRQEKRIFADERRTAPNRARASIDARERGGGGFHENGCAESVSVNGHRTEVEKQRPRSMRGKVAACVPVALSLTDRGRPRQRHRRRDSIDDDRARATSRTACPIRAQGRWETFCLNWAKIWRGNFPGIGRCSRKGRTPPPQFLAIAIVALVTFRRWELRASQVTESGHENTHGGIWSAKNVYESDKREKLPMAQAHWGPLGSF